MGTDKFGKAFEFNKLCGSKYYLFSNLFKEITNIS